MVAPSSPPAPGGVGVGSATRRAPGLLLPRAPRAHSPCPPGVILSPAQDLGSLNPTRCRQPPPAVRGGLCWQIPGTLRAPWCAPRRAPFALLGSTTFALRTAELLDEACEVG